jgi:hypothetical protein
MVAQLRAAFTGAAARPWFGAFGEYLLLQGFAAASGSSYATLLDWDREAKAAGYESPA